MDEPRRLDLLSVVVPVRDEEGCTERLYERVRDTLGETPFELIYVDDGSTDATPQILERLAGADPRVGVLTLTRNFGHQTALTAGLDQARGDAVVMLDGDLQDPPELIGEMLKHWRSGSDVVYAVRDDREGESRFKLATARAFYRVFGRIAGVPLERNSGDFRLMDRQALDALRSMRERNRFLRGMTGWVGGVQTAVPYTRDARTSGKTKYSLRKMVRFAFDAITSFSHAPLQFATLLGFVFSLIAFLGLPLTIVARYSGIYVPGVSSVLFVVLLIGGVQLITVGIIGEYVGRIYDEVKRRPLYLVRERRNLAERPDPDPEHVVDPREHERLETY